MFRSMRRKDRTLSHEDAQAVLSHCTHGVLAVSGDDGYPYAVPVNYVYVDGRIYFHSAGEGHKMDAILRSPKVSFAVVGKDAVDSEKFTTYYQSVIVFGQARIAVEEERLRAFTALVEKYSSDQPEAVKAKAIAGCSRALLVAIDPEHVTGKASRR